MGLSAMHKWFSLMCVGDNCKPLDIDPRISYSQLLVLFDAKQTCSAMQRTLPRLPDAGVTAAVCLISQAAAKNCDSYGYRLQKTVTLQGDSSVKSPSCETGHS